MPTSMKDQPKVKIGLVQMNCQKAAIEQNLTKTAEYIQEASKENTNILCFPEMSLTGYIDPAKTPEAVISLESHVVQRFCDMTKGTKLAAMAGIVEANPAGKPFITQIVAADGRLVGYYRKIYVAEDELKWFCPSEDMPVTFEHAGMKFGVVICADIGHGDLFAAHAEQGAKIVFGAAAPGLYGEQETRDWKAGFEWWRNACGKDLSRFTKENSIHAAVATSTGRAQDEDFPGGGYVFDPKGTCIAGSKDGSEGILYAEVEV